MFSLTCLMWVQPAPVWFLASSPLPTLLLLVVTRLMGWRVGEHPPLLSPPKTGRLHFDDILGFPKRILLLLPICNNMYFYRKGRAGRNAFHTTEHHGKVPGVPA